MTLRPVLLSIQALLATPEPDDPQVGRTGVTRPLGGGHDPQDSAAQHPGALGHPGTPEPDDPQVGRTGVTRPLGGGHDPQDSAAQHPGALGHPETRPLRNQTIHRWVGRESLGHWAAMTLKSHPGTRRPTGGCDGGH
jgi:hypothetical protein